MTEYRPVVRWLGVGCGAADSIGEHSDKTLDIARGTAIINFSIGATRKMTLRKKRAAPASAASDSAAAATTSSAAAAASTDQKAVVAAPAKDEQKKADSPSAADTAPPPNVIERVILSHNSVLMFGWETNRRWLHAINPDKRPVSHKVRTHFIFHVLTLACVLLLLTRLLFCVLSRCVWLFCVVLCSQWMSRRLVANAFRSRFERSPLTTTRPPVSSQGRAHPKLTPTPPLMTRCKCCVRFRPKTTNQTLIGTNGMAVDLQRLTSRF
jgi:hypothetical protein